MVLISPSIYDEANVVLLSILYEVEIQKEIFYMQENKSPGLDGMSPTFYKNFWNTIGIDVIRVVKNYFIGGNISHVVNHTFITLVPKRSEANRV